MSIRTWQLKLPAKARQRSHYLEIVLYVSKNLKPSQSICEKWNQWPDQTEESNIYQIFSTHLDPSFTSETAGLAGQRSLYLAMVLYVSKNLNPSQSICDMWDQWPVQTEESYMCQIISIHLNPSFTSETAGLARQRNRYLATVQYVSKNLNPSQSIFYNWDCRPGQTEESLLGNCPISLNTSLLANYSPKGQQSSTLK